MCMPIRVWLLLMTPCGICRFNLFLFIFLFRCLFLLYFFFFFFLCFLLIFIFLILFVFLSFFYLLFLFLPFGVADIQPDIHTQGGTETEVMMRSCQHNSERRTEEPVLP